MNYFDMLLILILIVGMALGAIRGFTRQFFGLLSVWLAIVVDLWLYRPFSNLILKGAFPGASGAIMDSFAFIILMIFFAILLNLVFIFTSTSPEERRRKRTKRDFNQMLDDAEKNYGGTIFKAIGGAFMGAVVTAFWLSIILALLQYASGAGGIGATIAEEMAASQLVPVFKGLLFLIYQSVRLFTPGQQLPVIFSAIL